MFPELRQVVSESCGEVLGKFQEDFAEPLKVDDVFLLFFVVLVFHGEIMILILCCCIGRVVLCIVFCAQLKVYEDTVVVYLVMFFGILFDTFCKVFEAFSHCPSYCNPIIKPMELGF